MTEPAAKNVGNQALALTGVSPSFVEMCGFVAVRQAQDSEEVVRSLLQYCLVLGASKKFYRVSDFSAELEQRFGLRIAPNRLQSAVDRLQTAGVLLRTAERQLQLAPNATNAVQTSTAEARQQEEDVRQAWEVELARQFPDLSASLAWDTLISVLQQLFKRHGLQTLSLLDTDLLNSAGEDRGIRQVARDVIDSSVGTDEREALQAAVLAFVNGSRENVSRAQFLARLADSTVTLLSLTVPPSIAQKLREKLHELDLFLDTNILFGLIGLAEPELVDGSREVASAISENKLPLRLRFHEESGHELRRTFDGLAGNLRSRIWPPAVSAAAARSMKINTLTRLYHERNATSPISADTFLRPYAHLDVLLRERGALPYSESKDVHGTQLYDLYSDLNAFNEARQREKPYEAVIHDAALLLTVRKLRKTARSSLDSRAILVTNDAALHVFELECARKERRQPCTIFLRQLMQLLRPFVVSTPDFDRSFAEMFAASEFRSLNSKSAAATSKLLEILAAYQDVSEETASALIANDMLLGLMQSAADQENMEALVESALIEENNSLQVERDALAARLEKAGREKQDAIDSALLVVEAGHATEKQRLATEREEAVAESARIREQAEKSRAELSAREHELEKERAERAKAEAQLQQLSVQAAKSDAALALAGTQEEKRRRRARLAVALLGSVLAIVIAEVAVARGLLPWVQNHPQGYGLRVATYALVTCVLVGAMRPDLRRGAWITGAFPLLAVILQLLGGNPRTSSAGAPLKHDSVSIGAPLQPLPPKR